MSDSELAFAHVDNSERVCPVACNEDSPEPSVVRDAVSPIKIGAAELSDHRGLSRVEQVDDNERAGLVARHEGAAGDGVVRHMLRTV